MEATKSSVRVKRNTGWLITAGVVLALLLLVIYGLRGQSTIKDGIAPDFRVTLFDGSQTNLAKLRGQVVVLNFWASWCQPCRDEAPILASVWQTYQDKGVALMGVTMKDTVSQASVFAQGAGLTYPNGTDRYGRIAASYGVTGVPETFVITRDGRVEAHFIGPVTKAGLAAAIDKALQEPQEAPQSTP